MKDELHPRLQIAIDAVCPKLLKGQMMAGDGITRSQFEEIFYRLLLGGEAAEAARLIKQLNEVLARNGAVHRDENPGIAVSRLKRPKARITVEVTQDLRKLLVLEQAFLSSLSELPDTPEAQVGRILFSAARHGALLRSGRLKSFMKIVAESPCVFKEHVWYELKIDSVDAGDVWSPDPLTLLLIHNWKAEGSHNQWEARIAKGNFDWFRLVQKFFGVIGVSWRHGGLSRKRLLAAIGARLSLDIPPVLVDCALGVHRTKTLHPSVHLRLVTNKSPAFAPPVYKPQVISKHGFQDAHVSTQFAVGGEDNSLLRDVGRHLRKGDQRGEVAKQIRLLVEKKSQKCTPITVYLCQWVAQRLGSANRWGNRYSLKAAYTRLRSIARRLRGWLGADDPTEIGADKLVEIYEEIIDSVDSETLRQSVAKNLREFHEYMEDEWGLETIEGDVPWASIGSSEASVDAKIILPAEYAAAEAYYHQELTAGSEPIEEAIVRARILVMAFGYRAGLRRKEVIGLRIKDLTEEGSREGLVRPHDGRKLKSLSGNRRSPISALFSAQELELLDGWLVQRKSHGAGPDDYLFALPELRTPFINESLIFDHIQWLLQAITGDPSTRFHHLRHSFATWSFWRWMNVRYGNHELPYAAMEFIEADALFREREMILGLVTGQEPSEKTLYALSQMIGHSSPSMTLNHYIHSDQWMLEEEMKICTPIIEKSVLAALGGVTERQIELLAKEDRYSSSLLRPRAVRKLSKIANKPQLSGWKVPHDKRIGIYQYDSSRSRSYGMDIWEALQRHVYQSIPIDELVDRYCIDKKAITEAADRARQIHSMKFQGAGHQTYRHRTIEWNGIEDGLKVFKYPAKHRDQALVQQVLELYEKLSEARKKLVLWGVGYFLECGAARSTSLKFERKEELRRFLRVLNVLKLYVIDPENPDKRLPRFRLTLISKSAIGSDHRKAEWKKWGRSLQLQKYQQKDDVLPVNSKRNSYISLQLLALKPASSQQRDNPGKRQADWGFRLSLYVLAYVYGTESPI